MLLGLTFCLAACSSGQNVDHRAEDGVQPQQVVSANPCIDAIALKLIPHDNIAAISHYSALPGSSSIDLKLAEKFPKVAGTAEEIIALRPDIALLGAHTPASTISAIERADIKVHLIGVPNSLAESLAQIDDIAQAVGAEKRGARLKEHIQRAVSPVKTLGRQQSILFWQSGGLVPGRGTLMDDLIQQAGFSNASSQYGLRNWDILGLETILAEPPDVILTPVVAGAVAGKNKAPQDIYRANLLSRIKETSTIHPISENLLYCGGPTIIEVAELLQSLNTAADFSPDEVRPAEPARVNPAQDKPARVNPVSVEPVGTDS